MKTISFFIGSGCSLPSGQPSVTQITEACFDGEYYLGEPIDHYNSFFIGLEDYLPKWYTIDDFGDVTLEEDKKMLEDLKKPVKSIQLFLQKFALLPYWKEKPNYEDISGILNLISQAIHFNENNFLVDYFLEKSDFVAMVEEIQFPEPHRFNVYPLYRKLFAINDFISFVIAKNIIIKPELKGYDSLEYAVKKFRNEGYKVNFITTNYDCNLERLFEQNKLKYTNGFCGVDVKDDLNQDWKLLHKFDFFEDESKIQLIKIHGSINWYYLKDVYASGGIKFGKTNIDLTPEKAIEGYIQDVGAKYTPIGAPSMLIGNLSKAYAYSYDTYSQLLFAFEQAISNTDVFVVSGFGWSDKPLASRLTRNITENSKILIFDGDEFDPAIRKFIPYDSPSRAIIGNYGEGKPISIFPSFMSSIKKEALYDVVKGLIKS
jgi:hypothetical protein